MKIVYVLSGTPLKGGATKSFLAMADAAQAAGHEVAVVVPDGEGITPVLRDRGWRVLVVPYWFRALPPLSWSLRDLAMFIPRAVKYPLMNLRARGRVIEFARDFGADIVHDNTSVTDLGHYAAKALGVPHVIHVREYGWRDFRLVLPGIEKRLRAEDAWVVAITRDIASFRGRGVDESRLRVIYNGVVDDDDFIYNPEKGDYFLYAGRIEEGKGVGDLIDAYLEYMRKYSLENGDAGSGRKPLRLRLAGDAPYPQYFESLRKRVERAGASVYVDWLGAVDNIREEASRAVATVIPSRFEGFGRVMPEVMAAGSLCMARTTGGSAEQMENGIRLTGKPIAMPFMSVEELASLLMEVSVACADGEIFRPGGRYGEMILRSQKVVGSLYSLKGYGEAVLSLYSEIEAARRR